MRFYVLHFKSLIHGIKFKTMTLHYIIRFLNLLNLLVLIYKLSISILLQVYGQGDSEAQRMRMSQAISRKFVR